MRARASLRRRRAARLARLAHRAWGLARVVPGLPRMPFGYAGERHTTRAEWLLLKQVLPQDRGPARTRALDSPAPSAGAKAGTGIRAGELPQSRASARWGDGADPVTAAR